MRKIIFEGSAFQDFVEWAKQIRFSMPEPVNTGKFSLVFRKATM